MQKPKLCFTDYHFAPRIRPVECDPALRRQAAEDLQQQNEAIGAVRAAYTLRSKR